MSKNKITIILTTVACVLFSNGFLGHGMNVNAESSGNYQDDEVLKLLIEGDQEKAEEQNIIANEMASEEQKNDFVDQGGTLSDYYQNLATDSETYSNVGNANCSDYYNASKVLLDLDLSTKTVVAGDKLQIQGEIINNHDYPLFDVELIARVYLIDSDKNQQTLNGDHKISEEILMENIAIKSNGAYDVEVNLDVSSKLLEDNYYMTFSLTQSKRYPLKGSILGENYSDQIFFRVLNEDNSSRQIFDKN